MDYRVLFKEENEHVAERYGLAMERIRESMEEETRNPLYSDYFHTVADFILLIHDAASMIRRDEWKEKKLPALRLLNEKLYEDIVPLHYAESYANPTYAVLILGEEYGPLLSVLYTEVRGMIVYAYEQRYQDLTICAELFLQIYGYFLSDEAPSAEELRNVMYWYFSDYMDVTVPYRVREQYDPSLDFAVRIVMESDLEDDRYLYYYGEYITENERKLASFLRKLPEKELQALADTFTEGVRKEFIGSGRDLSAKRYVRLDFSIGAEAVIRRVIVNFRKLGWEPILNRPSVHTANREPERYGYRATDVNPQYFYDHRFDQKLFLDRAYEERRLDMYRKACETYREPMAGYMGEAHLQEELLLCGANPAQETLSSVFP